MKLLFDTHLLLWAAIKPDRLPAVARDALNDAENEPLFSAASIWEVAIKSALQRTDFKLNAARLQQGLLDHGYTELPVSGAHAVTLATLPPLHKDPFDRMLIAQAIAEDVLLLTSNSLVAEYQGPIRLV